MNSVVSWRIKQKMEWVTDKYKYENMIKYEWQIILNGYGHVEIAQPQITEVVTHAKAKTDLG